MLFFQTFNSSKNTRKKYFGSYKKYHNISNVSWASNHHIIMISEGSSCDTEDWSNDAENAALITGINYILQYIQIENSSFK